jgi:hypothetical protein
MRSTAVVLLEVSPTVHVDDLARDEVAGRQVRDRARDLFRIAMLRHRDGVDERIDVFV